MADGGCVKKETVIHILKTALNSSGVSISATVDTVTIVKDGIPYVYKLPAQVTRKMVSKFSNKFGVKIEWFYRPDMLHPTNGHKH